MKKVKLLGTTVFVAEPWDGNIYKDATGKKFAKAEETKYVEAYTEFLKKPEKVNVIHIEQIADYVKVNKLRPSNLILKDLITKLHKDLTNLKIGDVVDLLVNMPGVEYTHVYIEFEPKYWSICKDVFKGCIKEDLVKEGKKLYRFKVAKVHSFRNAKELDKLKVLYYISEENEK